MTDIAWRKLHDRYNTEVEVNYRYNTEEVT